MSSRLVVIAVGALLLSACTSTTNKKIGGEDPAFGEAVKFNAAMQTINPDPVYPEDGSQPGDNGDKGAKAIKRYRNDEVNARHKSEANARQTGSLGTTQAPR